jgi:hypothetical protein
MATPKQAKAAKKMSENVRKKRPQPVGKVLKDAGYSKSSSEKPKRIITSKGFTELMEELLPDEDVLQAHQDLLNSTRIEHMVFPLCKDPEADIPEEGDIPEELEPQAHGGALKRRHAVTEGASLSDRDIEDMLAEVNCKVRKIVHGETARHVYFWSPDATARKNAIELAYKIKGRITNKVQLDGNLKTNPFGELSPDELRKLAGGGNGKK